MGDYLQTYPCKGEKTNGHKETRENQADKITLDDCMKANPAYETITFPSIIKINCLSNCR